MHLAD